jgi:DNA-binding LacI/PurR family transcriptional regulator
LGPWVSEWDMLPTGAKGRALVGQRRIFKRFERVLQQALDSRSTLWVAASDAIALHCLEWLNHRGLAVPEDLALAGFDDTREALRRGLTSVRFDV